jgi:putative hydrolase of the HAD superfamily
VSCAAAAPGQCLFIDDDPDLATAAIRLGYHGRAICRDGQPPPGVPSIASLTEVLELL